MKIARAVLGKEAFYGIVDGETIRPVLGTPYGGIRPDGREYPLGDVRLFAPVEPGKVICVGRNYVAHVNELKNEMPREPFLFYKPVSAIIGPGDEVLYPAVTHRLDHEAELAVVIGKRAAAVSPGHAREYIFGYTCLNDITARDVQAREKHFVRAKGCDTCCPIGPWVETELDAGGTRIRCRVNGRTTQDSSTSLMIFSIDRLICYITECITLYPGDVISTGTPAGVSPMLPGDRVEVEIDGIGILGNRIVRPWTD